MFANVFNAKTIALLAAIAAPAFGQDGAYFVLSSGQALVTERLDPLLDPGKTSAHVHSIVGGNAFASTMDFAKTQTSTCSTIPVKADNSNYWMPTVYFHAKNGSFIRVPEQPYHKIYYKFGKGNNTPDLERSEFPQGFRMMTGSSSLRSDDGSFGTAGNQLNWQCHGSSTTTATGFPKGFTNCNGNYIGGLAATMRFPSCWSGADFDPTKPMAHMDFPTNADGLAGCRPGFQKARFVEIMIEYWLDTSSFDGEYSANDMPWVLSSGDPTGYGFHMDFVRTYLECVFRDY